MYEYLTPSEFIIVRVLFMLSFIGVLYLFATRVRFLYEAISLGIPDPKPRFDNPLKRVSSVLTFVFGQKRVLMFFGGIGHFVIFWGFLLISLATAEFLVNAVFPEVSFWNIPGFAVIGFIVDIISLGVLIAIVVSVFRRLFIKPVRLKGPLSGTIDAMIILSLITTLVVTYLLMAAMRINAGEISAAWAPISYLLTGIVPAAKEGAVTENAKIVFGVFWIIHLASLLFFIYYIPRSKHLHILGAIPNIYLRDFGATGVINKMDLENEEAESFGVNAAEQFTWKQLLDTYACTECGRCQEQCPAYNTGKELTPKGLVHELKEHLFERAPVILEEGKMSAEKLEGNEREVRNPEQEPYRRRIQREIHLGLYFMPGLPDLLPGVDRARATYHGYEALPCLDRVEDELGGPACNAQHGKEFEPMGPRPAFTGRMGCRPRYSNHGRKGKRRRISPLSWLFRFS